MTEQEFEKAVDDLCLAVFSEVMNLENPNYADYDKFTKIKRSKIMTAFREAKAEMPESQQG